MASTRPTGYVVYRINEADTNFYNNRYNRTSIIKRHMQNIRYTAPLSVESVFMLKLFTERIVKQISALMVLTANHTTLEWDYELMDVIVEKLDAATNKKWKIILRTVTAIRGDLGLWTLLEFLMVRCNNFELEHDEPRPSDLVDMTAKCRVCEVRHHYYPISTFIVREEVKFRRVAGFNLCKDCLRRGHVHEICIMSSHCGKCKLYRHMLNSGGGVEPSRLVIALAKNFESPSDYIAKRLPCHKDVYSINDVIRMKNSLFNEIDDVLPDYD